MIVFPIILLLSMNSLATCLLSYEYRLVGLRSIVVVPPTSVFPSEILPSLVCNLDPEKLLSMCKEAIATPYCRQNDFTLIANDNVGEEKKYYITYENDWLMDNLSEFVSACSCPTEPEILFEDGPTEETIRVLIDREKLVEYLFTKYIEHKVNVGNFESRKKFKEKFKHFWMHRKHEKVLSGNNNDDDEYSIGGPIPPRLNDLALRP